MSKPSLTFPALRVAGALGYLALVPFVGCAALVWLPDVDLRNAAALALSAYAAVVVSFIGAIHWGLGFRQAQPATSLFVWGVVPSIVAWIAVLVPFRAGLVTQALMLAVCYLVDRRVYVREGVAAWLPLRRSLTIPAALCCLVGAFGS
jgi:hypothetical protein